ncbi:MAG: hypothetical protein ACOYOU_01075 [Kiritimatiellia bacterium]
MTSKLIWAGVAMLGCLAVSCANGANAPAAGIRSPEWNNNLKLAVNDATKAAAAMQAMPEADRAAFAAEVLAALQTKRQHMSNKGTWANDFAAIAAGLVAGSGAAKPAVLSAVAAGIVSACVDPETRELTNGSLAQLGALAKRVEAQLKSEDRVAFAHTLLVTIDKQKAVDAAAHKQAMSVAALGLFAGSGDVSSRVIAEAFAVTDVNDLGAVAKVFSDTFNQRKNKTGNEEYLQLALQIEQAVAARVKGMADATTRLAYVVAAFLDGAANPAQFKKQLLGKLADLQDGNWATEESFASVLAAAKKDVTACAGIGHELADLLRIDRNTPFVHENRPIPSTYQNQ